MKQGKVGWINGLEGKSCFKLQIGGREDKEEIWEEGVAWLD